MTTKNFAQMTTKKLQALLQTASAEDQVKIQEVLKARAAIATEAPAPVAEEPEAPAKATAKKEPKAPKAPRYTHDELTAIADTCRENIGHCCQVVPFNTAEWVDGYIAGVTTDDRAGKVLYRIKLQDGRNVVKVHDTKLLKILETMAELPARAHVGRVAKPREEWTDEAIAAELAALMPSVGKLATFSEAGKDEPTTGRIVALVPEKRAQKIMLRIVVEAPTEEDPKATRIVHKIAGSEAAGLTIAEDFDEAGAALNAQYVERRAKAAARETLAPADRVVRCEEAVRKAEESLAKAQKTLETRMAELEKAKAEAAEAVASNEQ